MDQGESKATAECGVCKNLHSRIKTAAEERDPTRETDARVLLRRHSRKEHGTELPYSWQPDGGMR